jgi:hypothetical protein
MISVTPGLRSPYHLQAMEVGLIIIALLYLALSISAIVGIFRQSSVRR